MLHTQAILKMKIKKFYLIVYFHFIKKLRFYMLDNREITLPFEVWRNDTISPKIKAIYMVEKPKGMCLMSEEKRRELRKKRKKK